MIIEKKDVDFLSILMDDTQNGFFSDGFLSETLKQTKIFHFLMAKRVLAGEPIEDLKEIAEKLDKFLAND